LELSVVTKEKKRKEKERLFARKKVEIERRRTGRLIPYQIPNAQKGRKKERKKNMEDCSHGRKSKKERKEKNSKIDSIPNS